MSIDFWEIVITRVSKSPLHVRQAHAAVLRFAIHNTTVLHYTLIELTVKSKIIELAFENCESIYIFDFWEYLSLFPETSYMLVKRVQSLCILKRIVKSICIFDYCEYLNLLPEISYSLVKRVQSFYMLKRNVKSICIFELRIVKIVCLFDFCEYLSLLPEIPHTLVKRMQSFYMLKFPMSCIYDEEKIIRDLPGRTSPKKKRCIRCT